MEKIVLERRLANTRRHPDNDLLLALQLQCWPNGKPTLGECQVFHLKHDRNYVYELKHILSRSMNRVTHITFNPSAVRPVYMAYTFTSMFQTN